MKRSVSSVLAERIKQRRAVTPRKIKVRLVKFSPEEMAIDAGDIDASKGPFISRGSKEWNEFFSFKKGFVRLDPAIRKAFPDDKAVNEALRKVIEIRQIPISRKKSA
jgi:hypothetical protein